MAIFSCARWRPVANVGGSLTANFGLVLHHAVANGSLYDFFNSPSSGVSAHFWVARDGTIEQYVDSSRVAWHGVQLNSRYCGVETEGCTTPPYAEPMTDAMISSLARLYAEGHERHGWPNALANADGQHGFGYHRMAVNTACPCDVRLNERPTILSRAFSTPTPTPTPEEEPEVILISYQGGGTAIYDGQYKTPVTDVASGNAFKEAGIKQAVVSRAQFDRIPWIP